MQAIGMIETKGLVAAIESADVMLKSAHVQLRSKTLVKGGIVTITISGDVGAVKSAVDAGAAAVIQMGGCLLSQHVIARPAESIGGLISPDEGDPNDPNDTTKDPLEALQEVACQETEIQVSELVVSVNIETVSEADVPPSAQEKAVSAERITRPARPRPKKR